jgi:iron-regulated transporter 1
VLYYAKSYADWDISNGSAPSDDILLYGTDIAQHAVPLYVSAWQLGGDLTSAANASADESYVPVSLALACADGKRPPAPAVAAAVVAKAAGPILTPDEMEAKYRQIFERYARRPEPNPNVNFSFVIMLVMIGLTVVLAIPYMLVRRARAPPGGAGAGGAGGAGSSSKVGYAPVATSSGGVASSSFAAVIQQSKKKSSGHIN